MEDITLYLDRVCVYIKYHLKKHKIDTKLESNWDIVTK